MIDMLLNASITGGIIILLWYLTYPLSRKYFKASWHYTVLKITMLFMLFPVALFAPLFNNLFAEAFPHSNLHISKQIQRVSINSETIDSVNTALSDFVFPVVEYSPQLNQTDNAVEHLDKANNNARNLSDYLKSTIPNIPYLQIMWLVIAVTLLSNGILKMQKFKKQILTNSSNNVEYETHELFMQCRNQLNIHSRISLRTSKHTKTPFVFGLINPIIIFPEINMNTDEKRLALLHELTHIKNGDLWLKFFAFFISAVHWFNPLAHLLYREISFISEEYCDEQIVKKMTQNEKLLYGNLILRVVTDISVPHSKFCSTLSATTKNIKRRLCNMINTKKSRKSMVALSIIVTFTLCSLATIYTVAASTNTNVTEKGLEDIKETNMSLNTNVKLINDINNTVTIKIGELQITTPKGQEPIQNENGTITLPGGGSYMLPNGDKMTVSSNAIIKDDGVVPGAPIDKGKRFTGDFLNSGVKITIQCINGDIITIEEDGTILINDKALSEMTSSLEVLEILAILQNYLSFNGYTLIGGHFIDDSGLDYVHDWERFKENNVFPEDFEFNADWDVFGSNYALDDIENFDNWYGSGVWPNPNDIIAWQENLVSMEYNGAFIKDITSSKDFLTAILYDETKVQAQASHFFKIYDGNESGVITMSGISVIELPNGTIINAPENTSFSGSKIDNTLKISIGSDNAIITQINGTSYTVPAGTVLNGEGNVIK